MKQKKFDENTTKVIYYYFGMWFGFFISFLVTDYFILGLISMVLLLLLLFILKKELK